MKTSYRIKTSVTLTPGAVKTLDRLAGPGGNRSAVVERAVRALWAAQQRRVRDDRDRTLLDEHSERLNEEAADVLKYQVDR